MAFDVAAYFECFATHIASIWTHARVDAQVLVDVTAMRKFLAAFGAFVRLFARMQTLVVVQAAK